MPETTPLIKAALNLRVGAGFDVYDSATARFLVEHVLEEFQGLVVMVFEDGFSQKLDGMVVEV